MKKFIFKTLLTCQVFLYSAALIGQTTVTTITNTDPTQPSNMFGHDAKLSADGSTLIVGAPYQASAEGGEYFGMVHVYRRTMPFNADHWEQIGQPLTLDEAGTLGTSVDLSGDGNRIVMGDPGGFSTNQGRVRIYEYNLASNTWILITSDNLSAVGEPRNSIGEAVAMSDDGNTVVVGSPYSESVTGYIRNGAVDILTYNNVTNSFDHTQTLLPTVNQAFQQYGRNVAITGDGNSIVVGAKGYQSSGHFRGRAYVYNLVAGSYVPGGVKTGIDHQDIGEMVAIERVNGDPYLVLVNSISNTALIYNTSQALWTLLPPYEIDFAVANHILSVDINTNGTIAIGHNNGYAGTGAVEWYHKKGNSWIFSGKLDPFIMDYTTRALGSSVSLSNKTAGGDLFIAGGAPGIFGFGPPTSGTRYVRIAREETPVLFPSLFISGNQKTVYPNPVHDQLNVSQVALGDQIILLDEQGNQLYHTVVKRGQHDISIDIQELRLEPSIYYLKISKENGEESMKRVVIK